VLAKVALTKAKADAEAELLRSDAAKEAEILRAQGAKEAANLIESSKLAVTLETIKASALAIKNSDKFFFGQHPDYMTKMMRSEEN
jgi:regulator of protease activity HflC (stomatin/prohibitin superfamily)